MKVNVRCTDGDCIFQFDETCHKDEIEIDDHNKCGSKVFLVDETVTHLEVDGKIIKQVGDGDLHNRDCAKNAHIRSNMPYTKIWIRHNFPVQPRENYSLNI